MLPDGPFSFIGGSGPMRSACVGVNPHRHSSVSAWRSAPLLRRDRAALPRHQPHWWLALRAAAARLAKCPYRTASGAPLRGPSGTFRGGYAGVVTPTVFTVGLMQGSTPRKAGCVPYRYACEIIDSGRGGTSCVVFLEWESYACSHGSLMPTPSAFPCTPRMRGATLQRASGENPWDIPACATIHGNAAEWRCGLHQGSHLS